MENYNSNYRKAAQEALDVQKSTNVFFLIQSMNDVIKIVSEYAYEHKKGHEWRNTHPILLMFTTRLASVTGATVTINRDYAHAMRVCRCIANDKLVQGY